jgi:hypothetical protein
LLHWFLQRGLTALLKLINPIFERLKTMTNCSNRGAGTFSISGMPLSVLNRALDLFGQPAEKTHAHAFSALNSAQGRISVDGPYTPLAQAIAEYMSLTGPWAEDGGEYAGQSGYVTVID